MASKEVSATKKLRKLMEMPGSHVDIFTDLVVQSETDPTLKFFNRISGVPQYDDRGAAIVFTSLLERSLEGALVSHFTISEVEATKLFAYPAGPLANFSAKIAMGLALGIYDGRMERDLKLIKHIRNAFAHARIELSFENDAVVAACDELQYPRNRSIEEVASIADNPRSRFTACVGTFSSCLREGPSGPRRLIGSDLYELMYPDQAVVEKNLKTRRLDTTVADSER
jgi:hypothetical protein